MNQKDMPTIVPASPGWSLVLPITEGNKVISVFYEPIIAWAIQIGYAVKGEGQLIHFTTPITVEGNSGYETEIIRDPEGGLKETGNMSFLDEQDVIERLQEVSDHWATLERKAILNQQKGSLS